MNRAQRRAAPELAKADGNEELESKVALFSKLPDECLTCQKAFDKKNKEMVMSWTVIVREEEEKVRLYCPDCWNKTTEAIKQVEEAMNNEQQNDDEL